MIHLIESAIALRKVGLSIIPVDQEKQPIGYWTTYQKRIISEKEIFRAFNRPEASGVAVICGGISGGFEGVDFDTKYDLTGGIFDQYWQQLHACDHRLADRLVQASTKNKGLHLYYRSPDVGNHLELAKRKATPEELIIEPKRPLRTLIETRSNGQYIIVPPSYGYDFLQNDLFHIPHINPCDRAVILDIARTFNQLFHTSTQYPHIEPLLTDPDSPMDDYDQRGKVIDLLKSHDWTVVRETPDKTYLRRPGFTKQWCSANFNHVINRFFAQTTSTIFEWRKPYKPSAVYAYLECNKDFTLAAQRLLLLGFGVAYKDRVKPSYNNIKHQPCKRKKTG